MNKLFLVTLLLCGCRVSKVNDQELADGCEAACMKMAEYGCPEGLSEHCIPLCRRIQASGYLSVDVECIVNAVGLSSLTKCGVCNE